MQLIGQDGGYIPVENTEVLAKLKEGYRFTSVGVLISHKNDVTTLFLFERPTKGYDREHQHQKLIRLLESGHWQIGRKYCEP